MDVKLATTRDWIRKSKGVSAHKNGKQWKLKYSEIDEWVQNGKSTIEKNSEEQLR